MTVLFTIGTMHWSKFLRSIQPFAVLLAIDIAGFSQAAPAGWIIYPTPEDESPTVYCANLSQREWRVSESQADIPEITALSTLHWSAELSNQSLPHGIKRKKGMVGRQSSFKTASGWLLGFDGGEFGGGLWLAHSSGRTQQLSSENVHGFASTPEGVLIFVGLAHMGLDSGQVLIVHDADSPQVKVETLAKLDGAPETITPFSEHSVLVVTTRGISQIISDGTVNRLLERGFGLLYPNSVVVTKDGVIYVGMRMFVVRLVPQSGRYLEQWMVRQGCNRFRRTQSDCVCQK